MRSFGPLDGTGNHWGPQGSFPLSFSCAEIPLWSESGDLTANKVDPLKNHTSCDDPAAICMCDKDIKREKSKTIPSPASFTSSRALAPHTAHPTFPTRPHIHHHTLPFASPKLRILPASQSPTSFPPTYILPYPPSLSPPFTISTSLLISPSWHYPPLAPPLWHTILTSFSLRSRAPGWEG